MSVDPSLEVAPADHARSSESVRESLGKPAFPHDGSIVPQRACLVLPTTGEFDSRTYRIASALVARGHSVTVLARLGPGSSARERHPAGYEVLRVQVSAVDGLPFSLLRSLAHRLRRRTRTAGAARVGAGVNDNGDDGRGRVGSTRQRAERLGAALMRMAAIGLTVRSQIRSSRNVAPAAELYHGMAYMGIPVALDLASRLGGRVVYDARDIYVDAGNLARLPAPARRLLRWIERRWARRADRVITVNEPYAEVMAGRLGSKPAVVMNCSYRYEPPRTPERRFHEHLGLAGDTRVVLYQGGFSRDRGIEQLLDAIPHVPQAVLVLLGYGRLQSEIEARSREPELAGRVHVLPAVPPAELLDWVASADVVAMPIQPTTLNHRLTTPNKLFEAMAAGVPVVASDLPGMSGIVRETGCGLLVDPTDPLAIAAALCQILEVPDAERRTWGERGRSAALATYNWERQVEVLVREYGRLTGKPW